MKFKWMLQVQLYTTHMNDRDSADEVKHNLEWWCGYHNVKVFLSNTFPEIVHPKGKVPNPYLHAYIFVSNDKNALQKLADTINDTYREASKKDDAPNIVEVRKNDGNYEDGPWPEDRDDD